MLLATMPTDGFAGEFGHMCLVQDGRQCSCGLKGCVEEYTSERGLVKTVLELLDETGKDSVLKGAEKMTIQSIADACEQGDEVAIEAFRRTGTYLGRALATYASLIDPEAIILTGDMVTQAKWLGDSVREAFDAHVFQNLKGKVDILISPLNNNERDLLGASALAWEVKEYSLFK